MDDDDALAFAVPPRYTHLVIPQSLNVRLGPGTQFAVRDALLRGLGVYPRRDCATWEQGVWWYVHAEGGLVGWVHSKWLEEAL